MYKYSRYQLNLLRIACHKKHRGNINCKPWSLHGIRSFNASLTRKNKDRRTNFLLRAPLYDRVENPRLFPKILDTYIALEMKDLHREFTSIFKKSRSHLFFVRIFFFAKLFLTRAFACNYFCNRGHRKNLTKN